MKPYVYSQIEDAVGRVYRDRRKKIEVDLNARNKVDRMTEAGMFPRVGKGSLVQYRWEHVCRVVIGLELMQAGTSVAECARIFAADWKTFHQFCKLADRANDERTADVFLYFIRRAGDPPGSPPEVRDMKRGELAKLFAAVLRGDKDAPRIEAINLSMRLRQMREALAQTTPRLRGRPKKIAASARDAVAEI